MTYDGRIEAAFTVPAQTITATNSGGGPTAVALTPAVYTPTSFVAHVVARLNAVRPPANWTGSLSVGPNGTGQVTLNWTGAGTYTITWTSTDTRDELGFTADLVAVTQGVASVGPKQAQGLWIPDCPLNLAGDTRRAPLISDALTTVSPRGDATTLEGNEFYRHQNLSWMAIKNSKMWEQAATLANASFEFFWKLVHLKGGLNGWYTPGSKLQIYDHNAVQLGLDANGGTGVGGWVASKGPTSIEPQKTVTDWGGLWRIDIPELVSSG